MIGLVLWHNPDSRVGMIWCEDQGPLAFIGPEVSLPAGAVDLACGDQLTFSFELRDDVRYVRDVYIVERGVMDADPREIIAGFHRNREREAGFNSVA